ncbi:MAG: TonB-dependent receptor [Zoogloea sp.]|nr:TonB-dependent receptor [Zoogloea sp.]MCA0187701.1 TonB-dependent receptor [Pseudomonadota bacterium]
MGRQSGWRWLGGASVLLAGAVSAADGVFELGTVEVVGSPVPSPDPAEAVVKAEALRRFNRDTLGEAVALTPGMNLSRNSRNEDIVYLRGFDVRQVPLFIDGIPAYVPYDGYVDFGRFGTFDLAEIRVAKGAASLLYGPNTLGGAINLVSRKPRTALEGDLRAGVGTGGLQKYALNVGSNQGPWYFQLGASYVDSKWYPLSSDFRARSIPTSATNATRNVLEDGGHRENSQASDSRLSFKLGLTPNATDEYVIGYVHQEGSKGNPPYAGDAPGQYLNIGGGANSRFWRWPYWNLESTYFIGNIALGRDHMLKARVYQDNYDNKILAYTNGRYTTQIGNTTNFPSWYSDSTTGASVELASFAFGGHELAVAAHYKEDKHADNGLSGTKRYRDVTTSLAAEDTIQVSDSWRLRLGLSHDKRDAREVYYWPTGSTSGTNWLVEVVRSLEGGNEAYASAARKTRFPTIKDRYSARLGSALPNPDLKPEEALNFETGLKGRPWSGARGQAALFYSRIDNLMQSMNILPVSLCNQPGLSAATSCSQLQNIAKARHAGIELSIEQDLGHGWQVGGNYTYLDRENRSSDKPLTDTPRNRVFAYASWKPSERWEYLGSVEAENGRRVAYGSGNAASYVTLSGYALANLKVVFKPVPAVALEAGASNLLDANYALADGYPMPGRMWFANARYRF